MRKKHIVLHPQLSIHEISQSSGIPEHKLRYYERQGVLRPPRSSENTYRYFEANEMYLALSCQLLRSLGFTMQETKYILHESNREEYHDMLENRVDEIEREIDRLFAARRRIWDMLDHLDTPPEQITLRQRAALYGIYSTRKKYYQIGNDELNRLTKETNRRLPNCFMCYVISPEEFFSGAEHLTEEWGRFSSKPFADDNGLVETLPASLCVCGVLSSPIRVPFTRTDFAPFLQYIEDNDLEICGKTIGEIFNLFGKNRKQKMVSVSIPVRPTNKS